MSKTWCGRPRDTVDRRERGISIIVNCRFSLLVGVVIPKWQSIPDLSYILMRCHFCWQVWAFILHVRVCGVRSSQGTDESGCSSWRGTRHRDVAALTEQSAPRSAASASYKIHSLSIFCNLETVCMHIIARKRDRKRHPSNVVITIGSPRLKPKQFSKWYVPEHFLP